MHFSEGSILLEQSKDSIHKKYQAYWIQITDSLQGLTTSSLFLITVNLCLFFSLFVGIRIQKYIMTGMDINTLILIF